MTRVALNGISTLVLIPATPPAAPEGSRGLTPGATTALTACPEADPNYVNVVLQIDPNWPRADKLGGSVQGLFRRMVFAFVDQTEEGFSENVGVSYASSDVVGRDEQYKTYTGTDNRTIPMSFRLVAQGSVGDDGEETSPSLEEVVKPARWIESMQHAFADPTTGISYAPPPLLLTVGQLLAARVILTDCSVKWDAPFEPGTMLPHGATVQCTFTVVRNARDVEAQYSGIADLKAVPDYSLFVELPTQGPTDTRGVQ